MTLHVPEARVQVVALKVPVLLVVKLTVPVGVMAPAPDESATVTVQVEGWLSGTLAGEQETVVVVFLFVEARLNVPLLPECAASGVYVPVIRAWPTTVGV